jgi:SOUL heme-binding protein
MRLQPDPQHADHDGLGRISDQNGKSDDMQRMVHALLALVAGAVMAQAETLDRFKGYEMPPYRVEQAEGARELRQYGPHLVAEVTVAGDRSAAIGRGFSALAGYIFGGNDSGAKVAMTVPVTQTPDGDGTWVVRFMMPTAYSRATLPVPKDTAIRFVDVPGDRQVVERFSGLPRTAEMEARATALKRWAEAQGWRVLGGPHYYFYDAPMTLPWNRRNEVAFGVTTP